MSEIKTTNVFWDCECKEQFIHHFHEPKCNKCNAVQGDQPDSRIEEIMEENISPKTLEIVNARLKELDQAFEVAFGQAELVEDQMLRLI